MLGNDGATQTLLSAGNESVLVQWNLEQDSRSFVSRLGGAAVVSLSVSGSQEFYSLTFSDNSFKVYRFDSNKCVVDQKNLDLSGGIRIKSQPHFDG